MRKKILIVSASIVMVLVMIFLGLSYFIGDQIVASSTQLVTNDATKHTHDTLWQEYKFDDETFFNSYLIEKLNLTSSFDGHSIPADLIYSGEKSKDVVIMVHGLGGNRYTNYPMAAFFLANGYNVITYDQRSSGENTAEKTTFGYWEKYDLIDCVQYAKGLTQGMKIGVWGESFGGATAIQATAFEDMQEDISFLLLDCPVSSMEWMVADEIKRMDIGLPIDYMTWCGSTLNRMQLGFFYKDADSAQIAKKIHIPTLVMNSEADQTTPSFMGKDIYDHLASAKKELWTVADSEHVGMWLDYNEEYCNRVLDFIHGH